MSRISTDRLEQEWIGVDQARLMLGVSRQMIHLYVKDQRIRAAHIGRNLPGRETLLLDRASVRGGYPPFRFRNSMVLEGSWPRSFSV